MRRAMRVARIGKGGPPANAFRWEREISSQDVRFAVSSTLIWCTGENSERRREEVISMNDARIRASVAQSYRIRNGRR